MSDRTADLDLTMTDEDVEDEENEDWVKDEENEDWEDTEYPVDPDPNYGLNDTEVPDFPDLHGFSLAWEEPPVVKKVAPFRKTVLAWEEYLSLLTKPENVGRTIRVFSFSGEAARKAALARARAIRSRLVKMQPELEYSITVAEVPGTDISNVYASYIGEASDELFNARMDAHEQRVQHGYKIAAIRAAKREAAV